MPPTQICWRPSLQDVCAETIAEARRWVRGEEVDARGMTDILAPLKLALAMLEGVQGASRLRLRGISGLGLYVKLPSVFGLPTVTWTVGTARKVMPKTSGNGTIATQALTVRHLAKSCTVKVDSIWQQHTQVSRTSSC